MRVGPFRTSLPSARIPLEQCSTQNHYVGMLLQSKVSSHLKRSTIWLVPTKSGVLLHFLVHFAIIRTANAFKKQIALLQTRIGIKNSNVLK